MGCSRSGAPPSNAATRTWLPSDVLDLPPSNTIVLTGSMSYLFRFPSRGGDEIDAGLSAHKRPILKILGTPETEREEVHAMSTPTGSCPPSSACGNPKRVWIALMTDSEPSSWGPGQTYHGPSDSPELLGCQSSHPPQRPLLRWMWLPLWAGKSTERSLQASIPLVRSMPSFRSSGRWSPKRGASHYIEDGFAHSTLLTAERISNEDFKGCERRPHDHDRGEYRNRSASSVPAGHFSIYI